MVSRHTFEGVDLLGTVERVDAPAARRWSTSVWGGAVRNHVRHLLRSLGAHSRLEAVAVARRRGLIDCPGAEA